MTSSPVSATREVLRALFLSHSGLRDALQEKEDEKANGRKGDENNKQALVETVSRIRSYLEAVPGLQESIVAVEAALERPRDANALAVATALCGEALVAALVSSGSDASSTMLRTPGSSLPEPLSSAVDAFEAGSATLADASFVKSWSSSSLLTASASTIARLARIDACIAQLRLFPRNAGHKPLVELWASALVDGSPETIGGLLGLTSALERMATEQPVFARAALRTSLAMAPERDENLSLRQLWAEVATIVLNGSEIAGGNSRGRGRHGTSSASLPAFVRKTLLKVVDSIFARAAKEADHKGGDERSGLEYAVAAIRAVDAIVSRLDPLEPTTSSSGSAGQRLEDELRHRCFHVLPFEDRLGRLARLLTSAADDGTAAASAGDSLARLASSTATNSGERDRLASFLQTVATPLLEGRLASCLYNFRRQAIAQGSSFSFTGPERSALFQLADLFSALKEAVESAPPPSSSSLLMFHALLCSFGDQLDREVAAIVEACVAASTPLQLFSSPKAEDGASRGRTTKTAAKAVTSGSMSGSERDAALAPGPSVPTGSVGAGVGGGLTTLAMQGFSMGRLLTGAVADLAASTANQLLAGGQDEGLEDEEDADNNGDKGGDRSRRVDAEARTNDDDDEGEDEEAQEGAEIWGWDADDVGKISDSSDFEFFSARFALSARLLDALKAFYFHRASRGRTLSLQQHQLLAALVDKLVLFPACSLSARANGKLQPPSHLLLREALGVCGHVVSAEDAALVAPLYLEVAKRLLALKTAELST